MSLFEKLKSLSVTPAPAAPADDEPAPQPLGPPEVEAELDRLESVDSIGACLHVLGGAS